MTTINLKDFYYWYLVDELVEVPDEVAQALLAGKRAEAAHTERVRYNKAYYSLDCDDGIEYSACLHEPSPQEILDRKELFFRLWNALNSLPETQGRRRSVAERFIFPSLITKTFLHQFQVGNSKNQKVFFIRSKPRLID